MKIKDEFLFVCNVCKKNITTHSSYWVQVTNYVLPKTICISTEPEEKYDDFVLCDECGKKLEKFLRGE